MIQEGQLDLALGLFDAPTRQWNATPWRARPRAWCCPRTA